jgi:hypothetical protein
VLHFESSYSAAAPRNKQIQDDLGVAYLPTTFRALTESFDSKLDSVEIHYFGNSAYVYDG